MTLPGQFQAGQPPVPDRDQGGQGGREVDLALPEFEVLVHPRHHVVDLHVGQQRAGRRHGGGQVPGLVADDVPEVQGDPQNRRIAESTQRQAVTVALLGVALVASGTLGLITLTDDVPFDRALFEVTSAFATVGLSTGITPALPSSAQVVLVILMYVGRVGTIAVGTAIALNTRRRLYRYPEERPLVG